MKTLGVVGGIGPESTIDYYRLIIEAYQERRGDGSYPPVIINSIDLKRMVEWITAGELAKIAEYLLTEAGVIVASGSGFMQDGYLRLSFATPDEQIVGGMAAARNALSALR